MRHSSGLYISPSILAELLQASHPPAPPPHGALMPEFESQLTNNLHSGNTCEPMLIFDQYPREAAITTWTQWRCGDAGTTTSLYRRIDQATVTPKTTLSAAATVSESTFQTVSTASTKTTPAFLPSETAPSEQTLAPTSSKAWIAGAVAGPIVLIVLLAALVFFRRRLRTKNSDPDDPGGRGGLGPGLGSQGAKDGAVASRTNQFTLVEKPELDGSGKAMTEAVELPCPDYVKAPQSQDLQGPEPHELQAPHSQPHELGAPVPGETPGKEIRVSGVS